MTTTVPNASTRSTPVAIVVGIDVLGVGGVDHQQHALRQAHAQAAQVLGRQVSAGGIVRVGEKDDAGGRRHRRQQRVDVGGPVALRHGDRCRSRRPGGDRVDQKAVLGIERLVAGTGVGAGQQAEQLVRAGAANDPLGIEREGVGQRATQRLAGPIG